MSNKDPKTTRLIPIIMRLQAVQLLLLEYLHHENLDSDHDIRKFERALNFTLHSFYLELPSKLSEVIEAVHHLKMIEAQNNTTQTNGEPNA